MCVSLNRETQNLPLSRDATVAPLEGDEFQRERERMLRFFPLNCIRVLSGV